MLTSSFISMITKILKEYFAFCPKKCVNYDKSNFQQNSVKCLKDPKSAKIKHIKFQNVPKKTHKKHVCTLLHLWAYIWHIWAYLEHNLCLSLAYPGRIYVYPVLFLQVIWLLFQIFSMMSIFILIFFFKSFFLMNFPVFFSNFLKIFFHCFFLIVLLSFFHTWIFLDFFVKLFSLFFGMVFKLLFFLVVFFIWLCCLSSP